MHTVDVTRDGDVSAGGGQEAAREPCGRDGCAVGSSCPRCRGPVSGSTPRPRPRTGRRVRPERVYRGGAGPLDDGPAELSPRAPAPPAPPRPLDAPVTRRAHPSLIRALLEEHTPSRPPPGRRPSPRHAVEGLPPRSVAPLARDTRRPSRSGPLEAPSGAASAAAPGPVPGLNPRGARERPRDRAASALARVPTLTSPRPKWPEAEGPEGGLEVPGEARVGPPRASSAAGIPNGGGAPRASKARPTEASSAAVGARATPSPATADSRCARAATTGDEASPPADVRASVSAASPDARAASRPGSSAVVGRPGAASCEPTAAGLTVAGARSRPGAARRTLTALWRPLAVAVLGAALAGLALLLV